MTENPYAPPAADLGHEGVAGTGDIDIGQCLSDGWARTWETFPLWLGVGLVGLVTMALATVTILGIFLVLPVLIWGGVYFVLRAYDGRAEFGDLFAGFSVYGTALMSMLVTGFVMFLLGMLAGLVQAVGDATQEPVLQGLGWIVSMVFNLFVAPRLSFAYFYIVDRNMPPMQALGESWNRTAPVKWKVTLLVIVMFLVMVAGLLVFLVGVIPASMMTYLMWTSAFRQLAGRPAAA